MEAEQHSCSSGLGTLINPETWYQELEMVFWEAQEWLTEGPFHSTGLALGPTASPAAVGR